MQAMQTPNRHSSVPPAGRAQRWLRRLLWALGALLLIWALAWALVPALLKSQLEKLGSQALGRTLSIEAIDFSPWTLELTVHGIRIATADGRGSQASLERLYIDAELQSLLRMAPVVDAVVLDHPQLLLTHLGQGQYDIDDVLARLQSQPASAASAPLRFALYNLAVNAGELTLVDQSRGAPQRHELRKLQLTLPFLSNLDSQREVLVEPQLAFTLNGSAFDTAAKGTPFAQTRKGEVTLGIDGLRLAPYLPYLPAGLPFRPTSGVLDLDLHARFEQAARNSLVIDGQVKASQLAVADAAGAELLSVEAVQLKLAEARPLEKQLRLDALEIQAPRLSARRNRQGQINLMPADTGGTRAAGAGKDAAKGHAGAAAPAAPPGDAPAPAWQLSLGRLALHQGQVQWTDESTAPQARLAVQEMELSAEKLQWPVAADTPPASLDASLLLTHANAKGQKARRARLSVQAQGQPQAGSAHAQLQDATLEAFAPYVAQYLVPTVDAGLALDATLQWKGSELRADIQRLAVSQLVLRGNAAEAGALAASARPDAALRQNPGTAQPPLPSGARALASLELLEVRNAQVQWPQKSASVGQMLLKKPMVRVRRDADGQWMFAQWLQPTAQPATLPTSPAASAGTLAPGAAATGPGATSAPAWKLQVQSLQVDDGQFSWLDRQPAKPVFVELSSFKLAVKNATLDGKKPVNLNLSSVVRGGRTDPGRVAFNGSLQWAPVLLRGTLDAVDLPLHAVVPYMDHGMPVDVLRADANYKGQVQFSLTADGPAVQLAGDASLDDLRVNNARAPDSGAAPDTEELLSWKSLAVPGVEFSMAPGTATRVRLREVSLADFFARLVVTPQGQLQLQQLVGSDGASPAASPAASQATTAAPAASSPVAAASAAGAPAAGPAPIIEVGPVSLLNGRIAFSDRFIQPNYSASLTELQGRLSRFSSQPVQGTLQMADLELRGRAEGTASLEVSGKLNPLAHPLALDIQGRVRDLELSPLSAYSIKYSGYGIERGKLSVDVSYKVQPDGQLTAGNRIILNQLTFGDKVEGAKASLPVKLAVALLADRNGVIDVDLPISGSLNDPQFSIWPVVWKVLGNLITKALTAPFALFSGGSGADQLSTIPFVAGQPEITPEGRAALDKVASTLANRPALKMTVVGSASLEAEREAIRRSRLQAMVLSEKRRAAAAAGQSAAAVTTVSESEYADLLKEVYRRSDIKKPRNLVGMTKSLPVPEMEALLLASMAVTEDAVRELAQARGIAVRDYLTSRQVGSERLFLGASRTPAPDAAWKPHAELSLSDR